MRIPALLPTLLIGATALIGCIALPDLDDGVTPEAETADYPALRPVDNLLEEVDARESDDAAERAALAARVQALQTRATGLQSDVLDDDERERLATGKP